MTAEGAPAIFNPKPAFSNTVFQGSRPKCWNTMATPSGGPRTGLPPTRRSPELRSIRPAMARRKVVLPQPLGPTMQNFLMPDRQRELAERDHRAVEKQLAGVAGDDRGALIRFPGDHVLVLLADAAAPCASASCRLSFWRCGRSSQAAPAGRALSVLQPFAAPVGAAPVGAGERPAQRLRAGI